VVLWRLAAGSAPCRQPPEHHIVKEQTWKEKRIYSTTWQ